MLLPARLASESSSTATTNALIPALMVNSLMPLATNARPVQTHAQSATEERSVNAQSARMDSSSKVLPAFQDALPVSS
jgi:hypothetical protein